MRNGVLWALGENALARPWQAIQTLDCPRPRSGRVTHP